MVDKNTKLYFSVSSKPGNFGALLYNYFFKKYGFNAVYKPLQFIYDHQLETLLDFARCGEVGGISVSMPFKKFAWELVGIEDNTLCDNVNTIKVNEGKFYGYNTDRYGFEEACGEFIKKSKRALIFGNGCVARTISFALMDAGLSYYKTRDPAGVLANASECDFLINATPVGMDGVEDFIFTKDLVNKFDRVFDVVVKKDTNLIKTAKDLGKSWSSGPFMSMGQFKKQFEIYTGEKIPRTEILKILKENGYV